MQQLEIFTQRLPHKPYCSDDKTARLIRSRASALRFPYIQCNPPHLKFWLPFDIDAKMGGLAWESADLPAPAVSIINPANGHAHLLWGLSAPVATSDAARLHPLRYLHAIESAMLAKLLPFGADPGFSGFIIKNPTHESWRTLWGPPHLYELGELAEWLDLEKFKPKKAQLKDLEGYGVGRNVAIFNALGPEGKWAYSEVRRYRGEPFERWHLAVLMKAEEINGELRNPLNFNEIQHIAKSVAKWVWQRDASAEAKFIQRQSWKGKKGGVAKGQANTGKRAEAVRMRIEGMTQQAIADALGVHRTTINRWFQDVAIA